MTTTQSPPTTQQADTFPVINPASGEVIAHVTRHLPADVIAAVQAARAAQPEWAARSFRQRAQIVKRFERAILNRREELFDVLQQESGKSRRDCFVELFAVAAEARHYSIHGQRAIRARRVRAAIPLRERVTVRYVPRGVIGVISPWNFPFILTAGDTIPALLAGNSVVLKPASNTPLTARWMRDLFVECGLPPDVLHVVTGAGSQLGNTLIDHVDMVMFTGSSEVGRKVAERAGRNLIPATMELGSKNAIVILPDAKLDHTAQVVIEGTFNNNGQVCINFERAYIHQDVYEPFVAELLRQMRELRLGTTGGYDTDIGSLISADQLATVEAHVNDAVSKGAEVLIGGRARPDLGPYFYEPTVLTGVTPEMMAHDEETFGPVLALYPVADVDQAITRANATRYGLHFAVAGRNRRRAEAVARRLNAGTVAVNDSYTSWAALDAPMGGFKDSGIGRRHGPEGIRKYCEAQTISTNRTFIQIGSGETALAINERLEKVLVWFLKVWRYIPFIR